MARRLWGRRDAEDGGEGRDHDPDAEPAVKQAEGLPAQLVDQIATAEGVNERIRTAAKVLDA